MLAIDEWYISENFATMNEGAKSAHAQLRVTGEFTQKKNDNNNNQHDYARTDSTPRTITEGRRCISSRWRFAKKDFSLYARRNARTYIARLHMRAPYVPHTLGARLNADGRRHSWGAAAAHIDRFDQLCMCVCVLYGWTQKHLPGPVGIWMNQPGHQAVRLRRCFEKLSNRSRTGFERVWYMVNTSTIYSSAGRVICTL